MSLKIHFPKNGMSLQRFNFFTMFRMLQPLSGLQFKMILTIGLLFIWNILPAQTGNNSFQTIPVDFEDFSARLLNAPHENVIPDQSYTLEIPMPEGPLEVAVWESPILSIDFATAYPDIKTYLFRGIEDPMLSGRITLTGEWLNIFIISRKGSMVIKPQNLSEPEIYILVPESEEEVIEPAPGVCEFGSEMTKSDQEFIEGQALQFTSGNLLSYTNGDTRRTYNLAVVLTGEFHDANGGTIPSATAVATTVINNVQAIYDRELAIRFNLLTPFVYTDSLTDPFTPDNNMGAPTRTVQAADAIAANFAAGNYDVGHVLHNTSLTANFSSGGVAGIGVVCNNGGCTNCTGGLQKGRGWSGGGNNTTAGFARLTAHEFGHEFGANHTFNGSGGSCTTGANGNISATTSYEIGSGTTIMSYRGICSAGQNVPASGVADDYFHTHSLTEIVNFINGGGNCATTTNTNNTPPVVDADPTNTTFNIPIGTPFTLTGTGNDADGDPIFYCWEQYDEDGAGTPTWGFIGNVAGNSNIAPLFRSYPPSSSPARTFPELDFILNNDNMDNFEALSLVDRNIVFRLTGRDFNPAGGGIHCSATTVIVNDNGGVFEVTSQNFATTWNPSIDNTETVTWSVAGTTNAPINCDNVNILLSLDGGQTFSIVLENSTPNDGSEVVTIPIVNSCEARIRVECSDNIFFDINNADFAIDTEAPTIVTQASDRVVECDGMGNLVGPMGLNAWLAANGGASAVDNCDTNVSWSNMLLSTVVTCGGAEVHTYRFTAEDNGGNTASTDASFEIIDTTPPDIFCPADITISCDESDDPSVTGMATAADICSPPLTLDYDDQVISGNCSWECTIERTWMAEDDCGNMNTCTQEIFSTPLMLIQDALSMGPITLGLPGVSLTLTFDDAECIVEWLAAGFGNAAPYHIPWGNHTNNPLTCIPGNIVINPDGTMANPLLAAQIFMAINLRLNPMLGDMLLSDTGVPVHMVLIISMPHNPTVSDLFRLTNIALGSIYAPHFDFLAQATQGINDAFSFCDGDIGPVIEPFIDNNGANIYEAGGSQINQSGFSADFSIFPNPAKHEVYFDLNAFFGQSLTIEIYNLQGQLLVRQKVDELYGEPVIFRLDNFNDGVYLGVVHAEGEAVKTKKFMVKK